VGANGHKAHSNGQAQDSSGGGAHLVVGVVDVPAANKTNTAKGSSNTQQTHEQSGPTAGAAHAATSLGGERGVARAFGRALTHQWGGGGDGWVGGGGGEGTSEGASENGAPQGYAHRSPATRRPRGGETPHPSAVARHSNYTDGPTAQKHPPHTGAPLQKQRWHTCRAAPQPRSLQLVKVGLLRESSVGDGVVRHAVRGAGHEVLAVGVGCPPSQSINHDTPSPQPHTPHPKTPTARTQSCAIGGEPHTT
jgi:hypothetical protein